MRRLLFIAVLFCALLSTQSASADEYLTGDNWDDRFVATGCIAAAEVISKSVTLRDAPSMSGGKIVSIPAESYLLVLEEVNNDWVKVEWHKSASKAYKGYVRSEYIVVNPEYITLRRSNTPAYSVPSREGKLIGSLSKMTRLRVIGVWDNYYVVYLRGGSAFIHKDADVWTETQLSLLRESTYSSALGGYRGRTRKKTTLRTGPGADWPEIMSLASGTTLDVRAQQENGWAFVKDLNGNAGYIDADDLK